MKITDIQLIQSDMADRLAEGIKVQHTISQNLWWFKNYKVAKPGSVNKSNFFFYRNSINDDDFTSVNSPVGGIGDYIRFNDKYMVKIKNIRVTRVKNWTGLDEEGLTEPDDWESYPHLNVDYPKMVVALLLDLHSTKSSAIDINDWVWVIDFEHCEQIQAWLTYEEQGLLVESLKAYFDELDISLVDNVEYAKKFIQWGEPAEAKDCERVIKVMQDKQSKLKVLFEKIMGYSMHAPTTVADDFGDMPF